MSNATHSVALIPAAGSGSRLGRGPKAYLKLDGVSLLRRTVMAVRPFVDRVLVGVAPDRIQEAEAEVGDLATAMCGGATRLATITALFDGTREATILVHDAARPFAAAALIEEVLGEAREHGAAVAVSSTRVSVARVVDGFVAGRVDRSESYLGETPQAFARDVLARALEHAHAHDRTTLSPWELLTELGLPVRAVESEAPNPKITTELDWEIAEKLLAMRLAGSACPW